MLTHICSVRSKCPVLFNLNCSARKRREISEETRRRPTVKSIMHTVVGAWRARSQVRAMSGECEVRRARGRVDTRGDTRLFCVRRSKLTSLELRPDC